MFILRERQRYAMDGRVQDDWEAQMESPLNLRWCRRAPLAVGFDLHRGGEGRVPRPRTGKTSGQYNGGGGLVVSAIFFVVAVRREETRSGKARSLTHAHGTQRPCFAGTATRLTSPHRRKRPMRERASDPFAFVRSAGWSEGTLWHGAGESARLGLARGGFARQGAGVFDMPRWTQAQTSSLKPLASANLRGAAGIRSVLQAVQRRA